MSTLPNRINRTGSASIDRDPLSSKGGEREGKGRGKGGEREGKGRGKGGEREGKGRGKGGEESVGMILLAQVRVL